MIFEHLVTILQQLSSVCREMSQGFYSAPLPVLNGSSVGQHVRHVIELLEQLTEGYPEGVVCYDNRKRQMALEQSPDFAAQQIQQLLRNLPSEDKLLHLSVSYSPGAETLIIQTNYYRELIYNIEHAVHHLAIIRIGIQANSDITLPGDFGVAASTIRYRNECAQ